MKNTHLASEKQEIGATVVINHRVRDDQLAEYNGWLDEIDPLCKKAPGHLDSQIIRPVGGVTATYTIILRFENRDYLEGWMKSDERNRLIDAVRPMLAKDDDFYIQSGLDFWFTPDGARAQLPVSWKQFLVTWTAIFPLALGVPLVVGPLLRYLGFEPNLYADNLFITGVIVFLMVYVVMPRYTKILGRWLFH
ncbi:MAG: hypothetical protein V7740_11200 [Pseudomonas marincola]